MPWTCLTSRSRSRVTPIDAATSRHSRSSSLSVRSRELKRCGAASRPQRSASPQGSCVHAKASLGCGSEMGIIGLGFDATDIPRVRELFDRYGDRFLHRVFTAVEIAYCTRQ